MILFIDNFDSFTYNLVQAFLLLNYDVQVFRNSQISIGKCLKMTPTCIVIGPGPKKPKDAGSSKEIISYFAGKIPILGICLGHQAIAEVFGGTIVKAPQVMHGKLSAMKHNKSFLFKGLDQEITMMRYHSLVVDKYSLPDCFEVTCQSLDDMQIMALSHKTLAIHGIQFHPESFLSKDGLQILKNFCCHYFSQ
ncbi:MAG: aminodeoxychorismate/anthranilate synthase component II [Chlamydiota bacterium]|jgi:anthranilate synthase/aminodeoxychorismate synthase-like glutamine amidotransferase